MKNKIFAAAVISAASLAMAQVPSYTNTGLWFDGSDEFVNLGSACGESTAAGCEDNYGGYWYDTDDREKDHGGSYITYPFDTSGYNGSYIAPMIEKFGYLAVRFHLADPTLTGQQEEYPYNFITFGFNTNKSRENVLDISATGGLCVTYASDYPIMLEIKDSVSGEGSASCAVKLPKSSEPKTVESAIKDFEQPKWVTGENKLANCEEAFKKAWGIWLRLDGGASDADGAFRVFEVGPKGTCKGERSIAKVDCGSIYPYRPYCPDGPENVKKSVSTASRSVSVNGRTVSLGGFGGSISYKLFDLQGNVVRSGYAAGSIDFGGVTSGNYVLKVNGAAELTKKIVLE